MRYTRRALAALALSAVFLSVPCADAGIFGRGGDGSDYPSKGKAIDLLKPAADYTDVVGQRPRALGIMRARAQGFVPSPALHDYVRGVLMKDLAGVQLPPSFNPDVRILAAPEFAALCTPDGTIVITIGLLEQIDSEDQLAFVLGHEVSHAIYRHHGADWFKKSQYYAVVNGGAIDKTLTEGPLASNSTVKNLARGLDVARHLAKLSANVLSPQFEKDQENAADALGFDLAVKAGYSTEGANGILEKLSQQEEEAKKAAAAAKASEKKKSGSDDDDGFLGKLSSIGDLGNLTSGGHLNGEVVADLAITAFDSAVNSMAEDATTHYPATEREKLLGEYQFREYRDTLPAAPTSLPWKGQPSTQPAHDMVEVMTHYADAETTAGYVADRRSTSLVAANNAMLQSVKSPTDNHAYTLFAASGYYDVSGKSALSEAALVRATQGPEPSWEVYARLLNIYMQRHDYTKAQALMDQAVLRFDNSPVLLPKRIEILHAQGRNAEAQALLPQCKDYDIDELYDLCKSSAGQA